MELSAPVMITPRLMAGVKIEDTFISIGYGKTNDEGRMVYEYHIDNPKWEYTGNDLKSGCGGGDLREGLESLLSFMSACGESYSYSERTGRDGENTDLFPKHVAKWCAQNSDELSMMQFEIRGNSSEPSSG